MSAPTGTTVHWEFVYGPNGDWRLTCANCSGPIYPGEAARITEDADGQYIQAECCTPRGAHQGHLMIAPLPPGPYSVVYADPPWAWSKTPLKNRGSARTVEKEYSTMQPDEIAALPVAAISAENSALLLWTTGPKLQISHEIITAWGYRYITVGFVWIKQNPGDRGLKFGMGFYTRSNAEYCLLATKGSPKRAAADVGQVLVAPVARHSAKPNEFRKRIERLFGDVPRLEMFARQRAEGWDSWGNQVPDDACDLFSVDGKAS